MGEHVSDGVYSIEIADPSLITDYVPTSTDWNAASSEGPCAYHFDTNGDGTTDWTYDAPNCRQRTFAAAHTIQWERGVEGRPPEEVTQVSHTIPAGTLIRRHGTQQRVNLKEERVRIDNGNPCAYGSDDYRDLDVCESAARRAYKADRAAIIAHNIKVRERITDTRTNKITVTHPGYDEALAAWNAQSAAYETELARFHEDRDGMHVSCSSTDSGWDCQVNNVPSTTP